MPLPNIDLKSLAGTLPYASERFGIYQPLLGWRGKRRQARLNKERQSFLETVVNGMVRDGRFRQVLEKAARPVGPDTRIDPRLPASLGSAVGEELKSAMSRFLDGKGRLPATEEEWSELVRSTDLAGRIGNVSAKNTALTGAMHELDARIPAAPPASPHFAHEAVMAGTLQYLQANVPSVLQATIATHVARWQAQLPYLDPLTHFDVNTQRAFLSPVGMIQLYREYFFELDSFLGPPVGHIWLTPGGSLELYEVHSRRTLEERTVENSVESTTRSETSLTEKDELSAAVTEQNNKNLHMGATASASGGFLGIVQGSASASFDYTQAHQTSEENAHKHSREQSEKLSSEIRRNFKTTFRTSVETQDQSSRRYVLKNDTDRLLNVELRRKMRRVGVQVQHIGTQLCWQVYVDEPGQGLGLAQLVHVAKPDDTSSVQPPEAPVVLLPKEVPWQVSFAFEGLSGNDDGDENYVHGESDDETFIVSKRTFRAPPPAAGYTLSTVSFDSFVSPDPQADVTVGPSFTVRPDGSFDVTLDTVNFDDQPYIMLNLQLLWVPPDQSLAQAEYQKKQAEYDEQKRKEEHAAYVQAVRERVKLASNVSVRPSDDLREEERVIVYRELMTQLTRAAEHQSPHVTAELIRSIFDVDQMLYFVAPDWWRPRQQKKQRVVGTAPSQPKSSLSKLGSLSASKALINAVTDKLSPAASAAEQLPSAASHSSAGSGTRTQYLTADDTLGWDGQRQNGRDNYLITEDSQPAPLGSSLGWLLQLDGDNRRNAFLNAPWVKAVIPIRPGKEQAALDWLQKAHVEGADGLDDACAEFPSKTIRQALSELAKQVGENGQDITNTLATERVFENGFEPLEKGFQATGTPYEIFDQWLEVLPTDQVVATEYPPAS